MIITGGAPVWLVANVHIYAYLCLRLPGYGHVHHKHPQYYECS